MYKICNIYMDLFFFRNYIMEIIVLNEFRS